MQSKLHLTFTPETQLGCEASWEQTYTLQNTEGEKGQDTETRWPVPGEGGP